MAEAPSQLEARLIEAASHAHCLEAITKHERFELITVVGTEVSAAVCLKCACNHVMAQAMLQ
jgi:hypothetical protein